MGSSIIATCQQCDYKKEFLVGSGIRCCPVRYYLDETLHINDEIHIEHKKEILEFIELAENVEIRFGMYALHICDNCNNIEAKYYYEIYLDDIELIPTHLCKECNNNLKLIKLETVECNSSCRIEFKMHCFKNMLYMDCIHYLNQAKLNCPVCKDGNVVWEVGYFDWH